MKKTFQYKNGEVKSYSDKEIKCDKLDQIELDITQEQLEKIRSNLYDLFIKDKKLVLNEHDELKIQKKQEQDNKEIETIINKVKEKYSDLVPLLEKIIKLKK